MLVKLLPDQVASSWSSIKETIRASLPPVEQDDKHLSNVLAALMADQMQCWFSYDQNGEVDNVITTQILKDEISGNQNLLIYSIYGFGGNRKTWAEGIQTLIKYARGLGCRGIVGYTDVDSIVKFVQRIGGQADYTFINIPVESES